MGKAAVYDFLVGYEVLGKERQVIAPVGVGIVSIGHVPDDAATPLDVHKAVAHPYRLCIIAAIVLLEARRYAAGSHRLGAGYGPLVALGEHNQVIACIHVGYLIRPQG